VIRGSLAAMPVSLVGRTRPYPACLVEALFILRAQWWVECTREFIAARRKHQIKVTKAEVFCFSESVHVNFVVQQRAAHF